MWAVKYKVSSAQNESHPRGGIHLPEGTYRCKLSFDTSYSNPNVSVGLRDVIAF